VHFLITGHTGFKGSWLTEMLLQLGHEVSGLSYETNPLSLYSVTTKKQQLAHDLELDIRDRSATQDAIQRVSPDFVIHFAAQALVRRSYAEPTLTFDTNVQGTMNVLLGAEACSRTKGALVITTDKVYQNANEGRPFHEDDALGSNDPYSASKALADLYTQSFSSFSRLKAVIARAGNVIGGGDVCSDRLVPDILRDIAANRPTQLRYPNAIRPWQHVLDCLDGYLTLLTNWTSIDSGSAWNVGPDPESQLTVQELTAQMYEALGVGVNFRLASDVDLKESLTLTLDISKLKREFGYASRLSLKETIDWTAEFENRLVNGESVDDVLASQVARYLNEKSRVDFANLMVEKFL
jgi:CDP-glucose 4,6-dehydratase